MAIEKEYIQKFINEMATVASSSKQFISVNPDPERGWYGEEYFKCYNSGKWRAAKQLARIKFRKAEYTYHDVDAMQPWVLNSKDKANLIALLKEPSKKVSGLTNWQYAILQFNLEAYKDSSLDYCLTLTQEKQELMPESQSEKYWLPIDLPMPDYVEL